MQDMVLLHGAGGNKGQLESLGRALQDQVRSWSLDLLGHNGRPLPGDMSTAAMARDVIDSMDASGIDRAFFVGYSFGGYVALYIASRFPDRVLGCCTIGTKYIYDEQAIAYAMAHIAKERLASLPIEVPQWAEMLYERGRAALAEAREKGTSIVEDDLRRIPSPVLAINGDDDEMVSAEETQRLVQLVPRHRCVIYHGKAHPLRNVPADLVASYVQAFIVDVNAGWKIEPMERRFG